MDNALCWFSGACLYLNLDHICLYLNLDHIMLAFSIPLNYQRSISSLQHPAHRHISINHVSLLSHSQHHHFRLNYFRIYFMDNKFEKIN
jgi:hypothetical protein